MLVNIMSHLPLSDRGRLAQTCRAFETLFCHPLLWKTATVKLYDSDYAEPVSYVSMVERFGAYIKDLTLVYVGDFVENSVSPVSIELIDCIALCCQYKILTLDTFSQLDVNRFSFPTDVDMQLKICTNQDLKSFTLRGQNWIDIRVVLTNDKLNGCLERLSLYWQRGAFGLPSPSHMLAVASRFTQLQDLYLQTSMMSDDLIVHLSDEGRPPLRELGILVANDTSVNRLQPIKASSWTRLRTHSPCLQVHVKVVNSISDNRLFDFLVPEMAIASLRFIRGGGDYDNIYTIAIRFSSKLRKVTTSFRPGSQLMHLMRTCHLNLRTRMHKRGCIRGSRRNVFPMSWLGSTWRRIQYICVTLDHSES